ncbi:hypothetical protein Lste_3179 [Legionella steelei]|uniref:Uncharacterized protein n=1 Tax=Legionella steelei TaxID=947033 RepID=A0A0W0ZCU5_9GAMM|nr:hypothetical protein [Legionella steelei]KTD66973.1 hypothetical protein Lste_3179 [Legionella steelei]
MPSIYITYAITPGHELVVASYHDKLQSKMNAAPLLRARIKDFKPKDMQYTEIDVGTPYNDEVVKGKLLELLASIKGVYNKVTYRGDLNLCTQRKEDIAPCLFDGTLNRFFAGKSVDLILESANREYVEGAIEAADKIGLTGAVIQTKAGVPVGEALSKTYPKPVIPSAVSSGLQTTIPPVTPPPPGIDLSIPKPMASELADSSVSVQSPHSLAEALGKVGVFNAVTPPDPVADKDKKNVPGTGLTN